MRNESGFLLAGALAVLLVLFVLGGAAMLSSELGYFSVSSERQYEKAQAAAEYALNSGTKYSADNQVCPSSTGPISLSSGASASYSSVAVGTNGCFIHGVGTFQGARVVKSGLVSLGSSMDVAAVMLRDGGTLDIDANALVANCDPSCPAPAVMFGDKMENKDSPPLYNNAGCSVSTSSGLWGSPYAIVNANGTPCTTRNGWCPQSGLLPDLVPKIFNATNWKNLLVQLSGSYMDKTGSAQKLTVDVEKLDVSGIPEADDAPKPPSSCECKKLPGDTLTSSTTTCSDPAGKSISGCSAIKVTEGQVRVNGFPAGMDSLVVTNNIITVENVQGGAMSNKSIFSTRSDKDMLIDDANAIFTNVTFVSKKRVNVSRSNEMRFCTLVSEGKDPDSIKTSDSTGRFYDSRIVAVANEEGAGAVFDGGGLERSAVVVRKKVVYSSKNSMVDSYLYAKEVEIKKDLADDVVGSIIYSGTTTKFTGDSRLMNFGTPAKPTLILSGDEITIQPKYSNINGILFSNNVITMTNLMGDVHGILASNGTNLAKKGSVIKKGNRYSITLDRDVLDNLATSVNSLVGKQIIRDPKCNSINVQALKNTKVLAY